MKKMNAIRTAWVLALLYPCVSPAVVLTMTNNSLKVDIDCAHALMTVTDKRINKVWTQEKERPNWPVITGYSSSTNSDPKTITLQCRDNATNAACLMFELKYSLVSNYAEVVVDVTPVQDAPMAHLDLPYPFKPEAGTDIILAHRVGMTFPVNEADTNIVPDFARHQTSHGGAGVSMPFYGIVATNNGSSVMTTMITPYDGVFKVARMTNGLMRVTPGWLAEFGELGYARTLRYSFLTSGGHVAIAKRYLQSVAATKVTLDQKTVQKPELARMIGANHFTTLDWAALPAIGQEMRTEGMTNIFWFMTRLSPSGAQVMNSLGHLTTRYDNYFGAAEPADYPYLTSLWSHMMRSPAFPGDILIGEPDGSFGEQWPLNTSDGSARYGKQIAYNQRYKYASKRFAKVFRSLPVNCIYLDTEAASPIEESWDSTDPCSRRQAVTDKIAFYNSLNTNFHKVLGLEGGLFAFTPYVDYFVGNGTLIPFTIAEKGTSQIFPDDYVLDTNLVARLQKSHRYYIPLWPLVFGDSVHLYSGYDAHNVVDQPLVWDRWDAIAILYGMPNSIQLPDDGAYSYWAAKKDRIKESYDKVNSVCRLRGTALMENHEYLTANRDVQRTTFDNGLQVTVNFGAEPYTNANGVVLGQYDFHAGFL
jgi:hypothetical protein